MRRYVHILSYRPLGKVTKADKCGPLPGSKFKISLTLGSYNFLLSDVTYNALSFTRMLFRVYS
jgi:hypothetical protein